MLLYHTMASGKKIDPIRLRLGEKHSLQVSQWRAVFLLVVVLSITIATGSCGLTNAAPFSLRQRQAAAPSLNHWQSRQLGIRSRGATSGNSESNVVRAVVRGTASSGTRTKGDNGSQEPEDASDQRGRSLAGSATPASLSRWDIGWRTPTSTTTGSPRVSLPQALPQALPLAVSSRNHWHPHALRGVKMSSVAYLTFLNGSVIKARLTTSSAQEATTRRMLANIMMTRLQCTFHQLSPSRTQGFALRHVEGGIFKLPNVVSSQTIFGFEPFHWPTGPLACIQIK